MIIKNIISTTNNFEGNIALTYFRPKFHFDTPENVKKPLVFFTFSGGLEMKNCAKMS